MYAKNSRFVDLTDVEVKKEYSLAGDPCENKISVPEFPVFDRVLVENLPEGMKLHKVPAFLQPELERFRSIHWVGSQRYVISFLNHADASRFMDVASAKYETEHEMRNIKIIPVGTTNARGRTQYVRTAAALGATRTIILSGIVDEKLFSKSRVAEDFNAFGKPYLVSWHPEQSVILFADMMTLYASHTIHPVYLQTRNAHNLLRHISRVSGHQPHEIYDKKPAIFRGLC
ncbi:hypothetical protein AAF712_006435 [Marasmius tenuissimus]|uniref:Uncharacterized protein n=1 Tax=Marasmius tenuissimus TaxID=585030 RepID=A0ABR2ZZZ4_9AGAR